MMQVLLAYLFIVYTEQISSTVLSARHIGGLGLRENLQTEHVNVFLLVLHRNDREVDLTSLVSLECFSNGLVGSEHRVVGPTSCAQ